MLLTVKEAKRHIEVHLEVPEIDEVCVMRAGDMGISLHQINVLQKTRPAPHVIRKVISRLNVQLNTKREKQLKKGKRIERSHKRPRKE